MNSFPERVEPHKEPLANGQILKSIHFRIPVIIDGNPMEEVAEMAGASAPHISRLINKHYSIVNKTFVETLDKMGYDIQITYVKKETN